MEFDSVQVGVTDLETATETYRRLLGAEPTTLPGGTVRFQLVRGAVELERDEPGVRSVRFVPGAGEPDAAWPAEAEAYNGLAVRTGPVLAVTHPATVDPTAVAAIDHVVVHSQNLDRALGLWRDRLGVRLALDREFPVRGLRMLFFRSAGVTLEFVGQLPPPADTSGPDRFYGLAYRVPNLEHCRERLLASGFDVSTVRAGNKPGTVVATVRSGTAGVPTLLLGEVGNIERAG